MLSAAGREQRLGARLDPAGLVVRAGPADLLADGVPRAPRHEDLDALGLQPLLRQADLRALARALGTPRTRRTARSSGGVSATGLRPRGCGLLTRNRRRPRRVTAPASRAPTPATIAGRRREPDRSIVRSPIVRARVPMAPARTGNSVSERNRPSRDRTVSAANASAPSTRRSRSPATGRTRSPRRSRPEHAQDHRDRRVADLGHRGEHDQGAGGGHDPRPDEHVLALDEVHSLFEVAIPMPMPIPNDVTRLLSGSPRRACRWRRSCRARAPRPPR